MTSIPNSVGAITLFIDDPRRSRDFYALVVDAPVIYEDDDAVTLKLDNLVLNLLRSTAAPELIEPASVGGANGGSRFQLTIWVDDADASCAELTSHGVALLNGPIDRPWGVRTAAFADPDGHIWEIAQQIG